MEDFVLTMAGIFQDGRQVSNFLFTPGKREYKLPIGYVRHTKVAINGVTAELEIPEAEFASFDWVKRELGAEASFDVKDRLLLCVIADELSANPDRTVHAGKVYSTAEGTFDRGKRLATCGSKIVGYDPQSKIHSVEVTRKNGEKKIMALSATDVMKNASNHHLIAGETIANVMTWWMALIDQFEGK